MKKITLLLTVFALVFTLPTLASARDVAVSGLGGQTGNTVKISLDVDDMHGIAGYNIDLAYDPNILSANSAAVGADFDGYFFIANVKTPGVVKLAVTGIAGNPNSGPGALATVTFTVKDDASSLTNDLITFTRISLKDASGAEMK